MFLGYFNLSHMGIMHSFLKDLKSVTLYIHFPGQNEISKSCRLPLSFCISLFQYTMVLSNTQVLRVPVLQRVTCQLTSLCSLIDASSPSPHRTFTLSSKKNSIWNLFGQPVLWHSMHISITHQPPGHCMHIIASNLHYLIDSFHPFLRCQ